MVDIDVVNEGANIYGRVESASLILRGRWKYMNQQEFSIQPFWDSLIWHHHSLQHPDNPALMMGTLNAPPGAKASNQKGLGQNVIYFQLRKWLHSSPFMDESFQATY